MREVQGQVVRGLKTDQLRSHDQLYSNPSDSTRTPSSITVLVPELRALARAHALGRARRQHAALAARRAAHRRAKAVRVQVHLKRERGEISGNVLQAYLICKSV